MAKVICSAFVEGNTPSQNALATASLLHMLGVCNVPMELCTGVYRGRREVSVQVTGFRIEEQAIEFGRAIIKRFKQECVLLVLDNVACTVTAEGVQPIGPVTFAANQPDCDGYTQFMDGMYMYAKTYDKPANDNSFNTLKETDVL